MNVRHLRYHLATVLLLSTLILAASAAGMAFLTRYIGVFTIAAGLFILLTLSRSRWKELAVNLGLYGMISLIPNVVWWLYVYLHSSTYAARQVVFRAELGSALIELRLLLMEVFFSWLPFSKNFTYSYNLSLKILLILGMLCLIPLGVVFWKWWKNRKTGWGYRQEVTYFLTWSIFSIAYLVILAYTFIYTAPHPDINSRMLIPIQFGILIALLSASLLFLRVLRLPPWCNLGPITLVVVYFFTNLLSSANLVKDYYLQGYGYTSISWHHSTTLQVLNTLPEDLPIITNNTAAVLLWTDRAAYDFCTLPCNQPDNTRYGDNTDDEVQRIFREQGAALVLFYPFCASRDDPWNAERMAQVDNLTRGLTILEYSCNGAIYFYP